MNLVHVVRFGFGRFKRYLAQAETTGAHENGHRPFVWTKDLSRAEKFSSADRARAYAQQHLGHAQFDVGVAPWRGLPTDHLGGSPAAIRMAA
ncbi:MULTISPECIES: hypothetical protein [unclassified Methylobacterium]|uniref:hypothetical protein n=1 Tax=unclassified Methylobacterium TaxID=2615210 RepID=UPI0022698402|nr:MULTISPECIES: hypothetical protein [unclassified Methylobacterium]